MRRMRIAALGCALTVASGLTAANARAVLQPTPGGITIPVIDTSVTDCSNHNVQACLDYAEGQANLISAQTDALVTPQTFQPTCSLTFTPIVKGGIDPLAFGWYNVVPDPSNAGKTLKPGANDLFVMMVLPNGWGTVASFATIPPLQLDLNTERSLGHYKDGQIGFWLADQGNLSKDAATGLLAGSPVNLYFTEHVFNPGSTSTKTYYQLLTWQSVAQKNAFYFGWEDLPAGSGSDNDFDDLFFRVNGIQCSGGGKPCDTGAKGVCAQGTLQCQKGVLTCVPNQKATTETCNALDDNCDGQVDEGAFLCGSLEVCDRGRCVPRCGTGEFRCQGGEVCTDNGVCVEAACATKVCPQGQVCHGGQCTDACSGVTCPYGQVCRSGGCVDPCGGITCDQGYACVLGVCQSCECTTCSGGQVCSKNVCVDNACASVTCNTGTHCALGNCVDDCKDAACPKGQTCKQGQCVAAIGAAGAGGSGGQLILTIDSGTAGSAASGGRSAGGSSASGGTGATAPGDRAPGNSSGCACSLETRSHRDGDLAGLLVAVGLAVGGRVRRTKRTRRR